MIEEVRLSNTLTETKFIYEFCWITDPSNDVTKKTISEIFSELQNPSFICLQNFEDVIDQCIVKYTYIVECILSHSNICLINTINSKIGTIMLQPVSITFKTTLIELMDPSKFKNFEGCVKAFIENVLKVTILSIVSVSYQCVLIDKVKEQRQKQQEEDQDFQEDVYFVLTPYLENGSAVYRTESIINTLLYELQYEKFNTLTYLSNSSLTEFILDTVKYPIEGVVQYNSMYFIKTDEYTLDNLDMFYTKNVRYSNLGLINLTPTTEYISKIYNELREMMECKPIHKNVIRKKTIELDEQWFIQSAFRIQNSDLPRYTLSGWWTSLDYIDPEGKYHESSNIFKAKLMYCAYQAYSKVCQNNPVLWPFIVFVEILDTLEFNIPITCLEDVENFIDAMPNTYSIIEQYTVISAKDLTDSVLLRYFITETLGLFPLTVFVDSQYFVVVNTITIGSITIPQKYTLEETSLISLYKEKLGSEAHSGLVLKDLLDYICITDFPSGNLMEMDFSSTGRTYCVPRSKIKSYRNPITGKLLDVLSLSKYIYHEYSLRGLFPNTIIEKSPSLLQAFPGKNLVKPSEFKLSYILVYTSGESQQYYIYVTNQENYKLFDITIEGSNTKIENIMRILNIFWNCGYLLTYWAGSVYQKLGRISSNVITAQTHFIENTTNSDSLSNFLSELQRSALVPCFASLAKKISKDFFQ